MATVKIDRFGGISPRTHPTLLQDGMAVTAENVKLKNGKLVPLREPKTVLGTSIDMECGLGSMSDAKSMHVWRLNDGTMRLVAFPGMTWMSPGNLADDDKSRVVVSGETGVPFTSGSGSDAKTWSDSPQIYMMANGTKVVHPLCKNPLTKPTVSRVVKDLASEDEIVNKGSFAYTVFNSTSGALANPQNGWVATSTSAGTINNGSGTADDIGVVAGTKLFYSKPSESSTGKWILFDDVSRDSTVRYTYFFVTWVDEYGYESPVSEASDEIVYNDGDDVSFTAMSDIPDEAALVRVYKVVTGTETGRIQFIAEFDKDTAELGFTVCVKDEDAGEVLDEIESPSPDIKCILDVPGGFYCGFSESKPKSVCFSAPGYLYSWPVANQYDVGDRIVALAVTSNTVFALTEGFPYVVSGTDPGGMTVSKLAGPAACVSARGVCVYRNSVYYVSNAGLMTIYNNSDAGTVCENLTDKIFTKDQWEALNPASCVMGQHDGALYLFFADGDERTGLRVDLTETAAAVTTHDEHAKCLCVDTKTDRMYFVKEVV